MKWDERHDQTIELALIVACAILILALFLLPLFIPIKSYGASCTNMSGIEPRYLTHKMDGDTISIFSIPYGLIKFRVKNVNTPERDQPGWSEAREFTWAWLYKGTFDLSTCWKRTLDRYEAVISRNGETLADALRQAGHGKP